MIKIKDLIEIKDKRKLREKHYLKSDGTYVAYVYNDNILDGIDIKYEVLNSKVKEAIILKDKNDIKDKITFIIDTNLDLELTETKKIKANKKGNTIFEIDAPYMFDSNEVNNYNIYYELYKNDGKYKLELILDKEWLLNEDRIYPVTIDPTITNRLESNNVYDTYIYSGDTNVNRNNQDILKIGVDSNGTVYRSLLKFELPKIGTGSEVIRADINLVSHSSYMGSFNENKFDVHQITEPWDEASANWNIMNNKYKSRIEDWENISASYVNNNNVLVLLDSTFNITSLVKKWYLETPNYGVMIKADKEIYSTYFRPAYCYSKNHNLTHINPKPFLVVHYRNQNGVENYMSHETNTFSDVSSYINRYNGNLTTIFNLGGTLGGKFPVSLNMVYNTNDVILENDYGYGKSYKLNMYQTLKEITIDQIPLLEYLDEDGTLHYFNKEKEIITSSGQIIHETSETEFFDEDGLSLTVEKTDNNYVMRDKNKNEFLFILHNGKWHLEEITDTNNNKVIINYDTKGRICSLIDANNKTITIIYNKNQMIFNSMNETNVLNFEGGKIINLVTPRGTTRITYNNKELIDRIIDINGKSVKYEYYENTPYRMKKISENSINNNIGTSIELKYELSATTIVNNKNKYKTYTFNQRGNVVSISNLDSGENVKNAYGKSNKYFPIAQYTNKPILENEFIKHVNNLLSNTSFEFESMHFIPDSNSEVSISSEEFHFGSKSLKLTNNSDNSMVNYEIEVSKGKFYTFSTYIKNNNNVRLVLSYTNQNNQLITEESNLIKINEDFNRYDVTIFYSEESTSNLIISVKLETIGISYLDDIQLEEGEVSNYYNFLENSNFNKGLENWIMEGKDETDEIITLENGNKALKIAANPYKGVSLEKKFNIIGKKGDVFNISFWYKYSGIGEPVVSFPSTGRSSTVLIGFIDSTSEIGRGIAPGADLNASETEWQFYSENFVAETDYDTIWFVISSSYDVNELYVTNFNLFKDLGSETYNYDEDGKLIEIYDKTREYSKFNYDNNNQLVSMLNPKGANFSFEYDNNVKDRVVSGISPSGISNKIIYDENDNPINTIISNIRKNKDLENKIYNIRAKGTEKYLTNLLEFKFNTCNKTMFELIKEEDNFKIKQAISNKYLTLKNNILKLSSRNTPLLFEIKENNNGSYLIKILENDKYLTINNDLLIFSDLKEGDYTQEFYFEDSKSSLFIENKAEYTEDGRFINKMIDNLGNITEYDINEVSGLTNSIIDSKGITTYYKYNKKNQIIKVSKEGKVVDYEYNVNDLLSKIKHGTKEYKFNYDDFLNITSINIGNNTLINNTYEENNGNLISSLYGNNHIVSFEYDEFERMKKMTKMNDIYNYKYDNLGNLAKIISNGDVYKYYYDFAQRINKYSFNNFNINYNYDKNSNVIEKKYNLENISNNLNVTYNEDNSVIKTEIDGTEINNIYDELGRLEEKNINEDYKIKYNYTGKGKKTSLILKSITNNEEEISYKYDSLNNITHIYKVGELTNEYFYDNNNQLIKENNYIIEKTIEYVYDNSGNILSKKEYEINTTSLLNEDIYNYEDSNWEDKLTKYNNEEITYDNIGNPLTIGSNINLTWTNGRELSMYQDENNVIKYKYNKDGIRISKEINNEVTKYYLENKKIMFEQKGNNMLYYIREVDGNLIGFRYNELNYYYIKNVQEDIIGILDSNLNQIITYEYDSWGNLISIIDNSNNNIGEINPFRYRSYYFDSETGLYYLNSRYYNPVCGRFINADNYISTDTGLLGHNMYSYTNNNPIIYSDYDGHWIIPTLVIVGLVFLGNSVYQLKKAKEKISVVQKKTNTKDKTKELDSTLKANSISLQKAVEGQSIKNKLSIFEKAVTDNAEYDLKMGDVWNTDISYNGIVMEPEDIGNFHYGYIGRSIDIPLSVLTVGAGKNQLSKYGFRTVLNCPSISLCDDMRDFYYIRMGAIKYDNEH